MFLRKRWRSSVVWRSPCSSFARWPQRETPLAIQARFFARVSPVHGTIRSPKGGFVTDDVRIDTNANIGGAFARGVFSRREIGYGREIMNIPAYAMYIADNTNESLRDQVLCVTRQIFTRLVLGTAEEQKYIKQRVSTLMSGGYSYFTRERDVFAFAEEVRAPGAEGALKNGSNFLLSGEFSSYDLQKLPLIVEFNRYDVEYNGRRGICLFLRRSTSTTSVSPMWR
ncbi:hypothetical protein ERJ75_001589300 [Trypanosoma vivax]|nr:hypothetical protein ERJ75_001589300 [Trypanosoma vivax]